MTGVVVIAPLGEAEDARTGRTRAVDRRVEVEERCVGPCLPLLVGTQQHQPAPPQLLPQLVLRRRSSSNPRSVPDCSRRTAWWSAIACIEFGTIATIWRNPYVRPGRVVTRYE